MKTSQIKTQRTLAAAVLFLVISAIPLHAQQTEQSQNGYSGGFGYFTFSAEQLNLEALNQSLSDAGFTGFNTTVPSWGGGGMFVIRNFLIGGQGAGHFGQSVTSDNSSASISSGYGQASLGYLIRTSGRSVLYPVIGAGGGGLTLVTGPKTSPGDFGQQLKAPAGTLNAEAGGWFLCGELTYNHFFLASALQGFFAGARVGYRYAPGDWAFRCNGQTYSSSPPVNFSGLYVTLLLGGGGIGR